MTNKPNKDNNEMKHVKSEKSKRPLFTDKERKKQEADRHTRGGF